MAARNNDPGLKAHRITQYAITIMVAALTTVIGWNYEAWNSMQLNVHALKGVPGDIKDINNKMSTVSEFVAVQKEFNKTIVEDITELKKQ